MCLCSICMFSVYLLRHLHHLPPVGLTATLRLVNGKITPDTQGAWKIMYVLPRLDRD